MKTIWKYEIEDLDSTTLQVPYCDELRFFEQVLHCDVQNGIPCLWIQVDTEMPSRAVLVITTGTGHSIDDLVKYRFRHVGSFMLMNGQFVGHVFAEGGRTHE